MVGILKRRDNRDFLSALVTAIGLVLIFSLSNSLFTGAFSLCTGDLQGQYVTFVTAFVDKLFGDGNFYYSFSGGLGDTIIANFSYFSCFSPFSVIYIIFDDVILATEILILLKFSISAFFFYDFCRMVLKRTGIVPVMFAASYAMSSFSIISYVNIHFMDALYLLPILAICVYRFIFFNKKIGIIIAYAYTFINCFYTGYVLGVFSAIAMLTISSIVCCGENNTFNVKKVIKLLVDYVLCVLIAILLSGVVILPTAVYVLTHMPPDATEFSGMEANILDVLCSLFIGMLRKDSTFYPYYYCGLSVLYAIPAFFFAKKEKCSKRIKVFSGVMLGGLFISSLVTFPYLLWHCMDAPDGIGYRFGYLVIFSLCTISTWIFEKIELKKTGVLLLYGIFIVIYLAAWYASSSLKHSNENGFSYIGLIVNGSFLAIYGLIVLLKNNGKKVLYYVWAILFFAEIIFNGYIISTHAVRNVYSERNLTYRYYEKENQLIDSLPDDYKLFRVHQKDSFPNIFMQYNVNGMAVSFSTFENYKLRNLLNDLGYMTSARVLADYGSTPIMQMLLSEKYIIEMNGENAYDAIKNAIWSVNGNVLSIGYLVDSEIESVFFDDELVSINPFENQNKLVSSMIGKDITIFENLNSGIALYSDGLDLYQEEGYILYLLNENADSGTLNIVVSDNNQNDKLVYAYFPQMINQNMGNIPTVYGVNGDHGTFMFDSKITTPHVIEVGVGDDGICQVDISVNRGMFVEGGRLFDMYFYRMNEEAFNEAYDILSSGQLEVDEFEDGYISGKINVTSNDQLLFFNVPYDKNWSAYVDGTEVEIIPVVNDVFMALDICEGEHEIVLKYKNPYISYGMILSMLGILFTVIIAYKEKKKVN